MVKTSSDYNKNALKEGDPTKYHVVVTCGPALERIDAVRSITNASTGELGTLLCEELAQGGCAVTCLRGTGATYPAPKLGELGHLLSFTTNEDLKSLLKKISNTAPPIALFHAAALCDFGVECIENDQGKRLDRKKIDSRSGRIYVTLSPLEKLIASLRDWFPKSFLIAWKYELEGSPAGALKAAQKQILENRLDACILNGHAWGSGFAFLETKPPILDCSLAPSTATQKSLQTSLPTFPSKKILVQHLHAWLAKKLIEK